VPERRRALRAALWALAAAHVAEALVVRRRARSIEPLRGETGEGTAPAGVTVVAPAGAAVDPETRAAAARELAAGGVLALDLVPGDLPAERAFRLLRRVAPSRLAVDPLYSPGGAHEAAVLAGSLAGRMAPVEPVPTGRGAMARLTRRAQRHAPAATALRLAPGLRAAPQGPGDRWAELEELTAFAKPLYALAPLLLGLRAAHLAVLAAGPALAPVAGTAALATWSAQPALAFARRPRPGSARLVPPDVAGASVARVPRAVGDMVSTARVAARRARRGVPRPVPPPPPLAARFEARRDTCPWCGSGGLAGRLDTVDLFQFKPGRFHLDECRACGHIFQNPALSPAGLAYYYAEFYDGAAEGLTEASFAAMGRIYRRRAEVVSRHCRPRACLDVGTGHGHFCLVARRLWPGAVVDGLDLGDSVHEAARRGWIDNAYRGTFPDLADGLPRSYDVVTMHHYLEHTREPRRELAAAAKVLEAGGHLVVETPDAASPWARRLGRWWYSWFQPQHQHFVPVGNLVAALEDTGFEVVAVERGPANQGGDLFTAVVLAMQRIAPSPHAPWLPAPTWRRRVRRLAAITVAVPAMAAAAVPDLVLDVCLRRGWARGPGNAYRVVARRS
jgi:SAM-dependent methyltransferase